MVISIRPIGSIHSPFTQSGGTPVQPFAAQGVRGTVEVFSEYTDGLKDLDGFERIWLLFWFDRARATKLRVIPYMDTVERGLFATRVPSRPNAIGMSAVRLLNINDALLTVEDIDILDGTPLLDIKPYSKKFDVYDVQCCGWLDTISDASTQADNRFEEISNKKGNQQ